MCEIRDQWLSDNPFDEANRWGALYGPIDPDGLAKRHENDKESRFILAINPYGVLEGYARYRVPKRESKTFELVLVVVRKRNRKHSFFRQVKPLAHRLMEALLNEVFDIDSPKIVAEICTHPVPNKASQNLFGIYGFAPFGEGKPITRDFPLLGKVEIRFKIYVSYLQRSFATNTSNQ